MLLPLLPQHTRSRLSTRWTVDAGRVCWSSVALQVPRRPNEHTNPRTQTVIATQNTSTNIPRTFCRTARTAGWRKDSWSAHTHTQIHTQYACSVHHLMILSLQNLDNRNLSVMALLLGFFTFCVRVCVCVVSMCVCVVCCKYVCDLNYTQPACRLWETLSHLIPRMATSTLLTGTLHTPPSLLRPSLYSSRHLSVVSKRCQLRGK